MYLSVMLTYIATLCCKCLFKQINVCMFVSMPESHRLLECSRRHFYRGIRNPTPSSSIISLPRAAHQLRLDVHTATRPSYWVQSDPLANVQCLGMCEYLTTIHYSWRISNEQNVIINWQNNRPVYYVHPMVSQVHFGERRAHYSRSFMVLISNYVK